MTPISLARLLAVAAFLFAGCGRTEKAAASADKTAAAAPAKPAARDGDKEHPIPLERALAQGLCTLDEGKTIPFDSRHVGIVLRPKVTTQPWIRIESGWKLTARSGPGAWLTLFPTVEQLPYGGGELFRVLATELERAHSVPQSCDCTRLPATDPLAALLRAIETIKPTPSWNAMETAALVLTRDFDLKQMRAERFSASRDTGAVIILGGAGGNVLADGSVIDNASALLLLAGQDPARFKLFREADAAYAKALADWSAGRSDLQALDQLGFFRMRPEAFAILTSVWTTRPVEKKYYRETAVRHLGAGLVDYTQHPARVDGKYRAALEAALEKETDRTLQQSITRELERANKAEKR